MSVGAGGEAPEDAGTVQATYAATLVDEWVRGGVTDAVVCPGSRSTPLALALAARPELRLHVRLDERGAGFFAVGLGLATGRPAVVCTTSGTAAAELHAAVVEAHHARVPLLACTADRPPELHHVGAPQTIEQTGLYGSAVRWRCEPGVAGPGTAGAWRPLAARALAEAVASPHGPGPVHLNLAFRDPLVARPGELPPGRQGGRPWQRKPVPVAPLPVVAPGLVPGSRGVLVAGWGCGPPGAVVDLADRLGWPLLADPRSRCRTGHPGVVGAADLLARSPVVRRVLRPDVVVLLGAPWASKALATMVAEAAAAGARVVQVDPWWQWVDPDRVATEIHRADPAAWVAAALAEAGAAGAAAGAGGAGGAAAGAGAATRAGEWLAGEWLAGWRAAEAAAQAALDETLDDAGTGAHAPLSEPLLGRRLLGMVPGDADVVVASSMPVRDLEWFAAPLQAPPRVLANRGANGIDGVGATAQGAAAAGTRPVVGVLGDLAFLHDASSLVRPAALLAEVWGGAARGAAAGGPVGSPAAAGPVAGRAGAGDAGTGAGCTLVVVDNGGGGIFNFLPQAASVGAAEFERLFGTPQAADVAEVARGFRLPVADVGTPGELLSALSQGAAHEPLAVVRARVPGRTANVALHERLQATAAAAAEAALVG